MIKPIIRIVDLATQEIIDRKMTDDEFAKYQEQKVKDELAAEADAAKLAAKKTAEAKLAALGLTADDLAALGL